MFQKSRIILALIVLAWAFSSNPSWANGFSLHHWADESIKNQGVMVFYITYKPVIGKERDMLIEGLKLHPQTLIRIAARHYYGSSDSQISRDQLSIQFMEPKDEHWRIAFIQPIVSTFIEQNKEQMLSQLYSRMR